MAALETAPLSICIDAESNAFGNYDSGVIMKSDHCGTSLDHCVTAVGYDSTASVPYVIIKNSWAADWGLDGYVRVESDNKHDRKGVCGIYEEPYLAVIN